MIQRPSIRRLKSAARGRNPLKLRRAIQSAIKLIEQLEDENRSLWSMLDELKESEIENHSEKLRKEIEEVVDKTKILMMAKTGEA
jgi:hypothetical protein